MAKILDGKMVAAEKRRQLKEEISKHTISPKLVIISVGNNPASKVYVKNKVNACNEVGIEVSHIALDELVDESKIKSIINLYNLDPSVHGIMVQLPLPPHFNEREIIDTINPNKDVDGLTTINIGKLRSGQKCIVPCTAQGIVDLLNYYSLDVDGQNITIIGRSNIVGKPLADLLMMKGATITQCHTHTKELCRHTIGANIIISAVGKPKFLDASDIGIDQTLIDVGMNRDENGKLCGDFDFDSVVEKCCYITPVPGGIGPMTVFELLKNTFECYKNLILRQN